MCLQTSTIKDIISNQNSEVIITTKHSKFQTKYLKHSTKVIPKSELVSSR